MISNVTVPIMTPAANPSTSNEMNGDGLRQTAIMPPSTAASAAPVAVESTISTDRFPITFEDHLCRCGRGEIMLALMPAAGHLPGALVALDG